MADTLRTRLERASLPAVRWLDSLPRFVPFLVVLAFLVSGIFYRPLWPLTALATAFLGWLLLLSWPRLTGVEKLMRLTVVAFFVALVFTRAFPR